VPIVVAITKMDKEGANTDRVKKELADNNLLAEDWGGDTNHGACLGEDEERALTCAARHRAAAEVLELKPTRTRPPSAPSSRRGSRRAAAPSPPVLGAGRHAQEGDAVVTGTTTGAVRMMMNDRGEQARRGAPRLLGRGHRPVG